LASYYPLVHRVAHGLCAGETAANAATKLALGQSLAVVRRWQSPLDAQNWFLRHTILASRHSSKNRTIWNGKGAGQPQAQAFFKTFGELPFQQREAFLLTYGERLDNRRTAIAMDCSTMAVSTHLKAATDTLGVMAGSDYEQLKAQWLAAYASPPPRGDLTVSAAVRRDRRRRWLRLAVRAILLAFILILAFCIWRITKMLDY
jgi:DNA-binding CsgD family transcriptional regulator